MLQNLPQKIQFPLCFSSAQAPGAQSSSIEEFLAKFIVDSGAAKNCVRNSVPYLNFGLSIEGGHVDKYQIFTFDTILLQNVHIDF